MRAFRDHLAAVEWHDALPVLVTRTRNGDARTFACTDAAYHLQLDQDAEYHGGLVRYTCQSPAMPQSWLEADMTSGAQRLLARQAVPGFDPARYRVRRIVAPMPDGARVPMTLLMRRDLPQDGRAPAMMYGYGAYGFSLAPDFSVPRLSLADRGWVVAIAHVRGGGERGDAWFRQTLQAGKHRTVDDFIGCAQQLIASGCTHAGGIVAHSFSAGGILIGGAINRRPELFAGAIAQVPFVDVLNTLHDSSNPLVASALPIWGDPSDPRLFDAIAGYSPYENVRPLPYPAVLATTGLLDDRVGYWEAAKWVARLRACTTSGRPVMLRTNMHAGHQGDAGAQQDLTQQALFCAFAITAAGNAWPCG